VPPGVLIEACVGSVESAIAAELGGAQRVELCDNLHEGGTTPSFGAIAVARRRLRIDLNVIIRPRGGDFLYSDVELETMKEDVARARELGVHGIVTGILTPDGEVDRPRMRELIELAGPLCFTFHRAFDMAPDPFATLEALVDLGIDRLLSSGQRPSAAQGIDLLARLVERAGDRIIVMPGVGIDETNIAELIRRARAREYHVYVPKRVPSAMSARNLDVFMGDDPESSEYEIELTDTDRLRQICGIARQIAG
jgi:copper homeostasis protein